MSETRSPSVDDAPAFVEPAPEEPRAIPRVRGGAMVWGVVLILVATTILAVSTDAHLRQAMLEWALGLDASGLVLLAVLAAGVLLLIVAGLALLRRSQSRAGRTA